MVLYPPVDHDPADYARWSRQFTQELQADHDARLIDDLARRVELVPARCPGWRAHVPDGLQVWLLALSPIGVGVLFKVAGG